MYDIGKGVLQDAKEAVKWYRLSADQGYVNAQFNLGLIYANGRGVLKDDKEAVKWYRLAADQGHASAQYNLGVNYYYGEGVLTNYIVSYSWMSLARYNGSSITEKAFKLLADKMSNSDVSQAQALSKRCLEGDYKDCD
jgi:TPR repeat protein